MFSHITLGTNSLEKSMAFYDALMPLIGYQRSHSGDTFAGYGEKKDSDTGKNHLWIVKPFDGNLASSGNGTNIAFDVCSRALVDSFYKTALSLGAWDEGKPGIRPEAHDNFYACYVRDPDGNKLVCVCHNSAAALSQIDEGINPPKQS